MYFYEVINFEFGITTRLGWVQSSQPISLTTAARAMMAFDRALAREPADSVSVKAVDGVNFAWICRRKARADLIVCQWPEDRYNQEKRDHHRVIDADKLSEIL